MQLIIPYIGELTGQDRRIIRLAEFLGISCVPWSLERNAARQPGYFETAFPDEPACFVVNPQVMKAWVGGDSFPIELVSVLTSRFSHLLVHGLRLDAFDSKVVAALSRGRLQSIEAITGDSLSYAVAKDSQHICGAFSGLSFGSADPTNDHVFSRSGDDSATQDMIMIGGRPFMALVKDVDNEVLFLACEDVADLDAEADDASLIQYFSRFVPHAMALRYIFSQESWRPCQHHATIIIDDPLLRKTYGFLNFESLHRLTIQHNFHVAIAFIPHNFRRSSPRIAQLFRENPARLSICFHGNDHVSQEFASTDKAIVNTMLHVAEERVKAHQDKMGLPCDKVMVFPQGHFSVEAMSVLKSRNFYAAVNTVPHPTQHLLRLTIRELAQPAVMRYGDFPLFIRSSIQDTHEHDIAFRLFFGRPILICEHHDIGQQLESLAEFAQMVNSIAPEIQWTNLAQAVSNSILIRGAPDGGYQVRAYSGTARISNSSDSMEQFSIEWSHSGHSHAVEQVFQGEVSSNRFEADDLGVRLSVEVAPHSSQIISVVYRASHDFSDGFGFRLNARAFCRRRLSEVRDNYLSKNPYLLAMAKQLRRRFFSVNA